MRRRRRRILKKRGLLQRRNPKPNPNPNPNPNWRLTAEEEVAQAEALVQEALAQAATAREKLASLAAEREEGKRSSKKEKKEKKEKKNKKEKKEKKRNAPAGEGTPTGQESRHGHEEASKFSPRHNTSGEEVAADPQAFIETLAKVPIEDQSLKAKDDEVDFMRRLPFQDQDQVRVQTPPKSGESFLLAKSFQTPEGESLRVKDRSSEPHPVDL